MYRLMPLPPPRPGKALGRWGIAPIRRGQSEQIVVMDEGPAHPHGALAAKFPLESALELARVGLLVGVGSLNNPANTQERENEGTELEGALGGRDPGVLVGGEHAQDVVVLVHGLAEVAALLLVPPVAVRVTELALDAGRVDVAAVLPQG
jgi:hypothetical protein